MYRGRNEKRSCPCFFVILFVLFKFAPTDVGNNLCVVPQGCSCLYEGVGRGLLPPFGLREI